MSVRNSNIIDAASIDLEGNVVLTISDHLPWDDKNEHLLKLQEKINAYLESIESGSLFVDYPHATNRKIIIDVFTQFPPNENGKLFLNQVNKIITEAGYSFRIRLLSGDRVVI